MAARLSRILLFGMSIDALKQFYVQALGCTVSEEISGQWVVLQTGGAELALHRVGEAYVTDEPFRAESNTKLVFSVANMEEARHALIKAGADMGEVRSFDGFPFLYCDGMDPEGNVLQLEQALG